MPDVQTLIFGAIIGGFVLFGVVLAGVAQWSKGAPAAKKDHHRAF